MLHQRKWLIMGGFIGLLLLYYGYVAGSIYGMEMVPDELGYWSYSAALSGRSWTEVMQTSTFFSYGYTLLLFPIWNACKNPVVAYRVAALVNYGLLAVDILLLEQILQGLQETNAEKCEQRFFCAAAAMFYPGWLFYAHFSLPEVLLVSGYLALNLALIRYLQKKRLRDLMVVLLLIAYLYTVHLRLLGVVLALLFAGLAGCWRDRGRIKEAWDRQTLGKSVFLLLLVLGGVFLLHTLRIRAEQTIFTGMMNDQELLENGYRGLFHSLFHTISILGIGKWLLHVIGKLYYLGSASYGLFWFGLLYLGKKSKRQNEKAVQRIFARIQLAMIVAVILVAAGFTMLREPRPNGLLYGRYDELLLPIVMVAGMLELKERFSKGRIIKTVGKPVGIITVMQLAATVLLCLATEQESSDFLPGVVPTTSYTFRLGDRFLAAPYYRNAYMIGLVGMVLVTLLLYLAFQKEQALLWFLLIAQMVLAGILFEHLSRGVQVDNYQNLQMAELIREEKPYHERCIYLKNPEDTGIYNLQFLLWNEPLSITYDRSEITKEDLVITSFQYRDLEALKEEYRSWYVLGHAALFVGEKENQKEQTMTQEEQETEATKDRVMEKKTELAYKIAGEVQSQMKRKELAVKTTVGMCIIVAVGIYLKRRKQKEMDTHKTQKN